MGYFIVGLDWTSAFWQKKITKQEASVDKIALSEQTFQLNFVAKL